MTNTENQTSLVSLLFEIRKTFVWRERHRRGASTHPAAPGVDANNATGIRDSRSAQRGVGEKAAVRCRARQVPEIPACGDGRSRKKPENAGKSRKKSDKGAEKFHCFAEFTYYRACARRIQCFFGAWAFKGYRKSLSRIRCILPTPANPAASPLWPARRALRQAPSRPVRSSQAGGSTRCAPPPPCGRPPAGREPSPASARAPCR